MYKRGWLRIVEASFALLIILSILFMLYGRTSATSSTLDERARLILSELSTSSTFREAVLAHDTAFVNQSIAERIPEPYLTFEARICNLEEVCGKSGFSEGDVFAAERIISSSIDLPGVEGSTPQKIRLFIWRKEA